MGDLATVMWKEAREVLAHRRSLTIFLFGILLFGILPALVFRHPGLRGGGRLSGEFLDWIRLGYGLFAAVVIGLQTAPDLVLHERVGHSFEYLLSTRLPDAAIYSGKVLTAAIMSYLAGWLALGVQVLATAVIDGHGWQWLYLGMPAGRTAAFLMLAGLSVYVSVIGTFVAFRVGDQRTAYMVSMLGVAVLAVPFALQWISLSFTSSWITHASLIFDLFSAVVGVIGLLFFRRQMLVLYLQE